MGGERQIIITKQKNVSPHNENHSKAERRRQDTTNKVVRVLQHSGAPLVYWCYALLFVVDCLNHITKKILDWKTSAEILNGYPANILAVCYRFWKPI